MEVVGILSGKAGEPLLVGPCPPDARTGAAASLVGGKASTLFRLRDLGLRVPPFLVLTTALFRRLDAEPWLLSRLLPAIEAAIGSWGGGLVAVRSSMSVEDGRADSFAGVFDSFLGVPPAELEASVRACAASGRGPRAAAYLRERGLAATVVQPAVIVQRLVRARSAGVTFSRAPLGNSALLCTEACWGLGEGVVAGDAATTRYWTDRFGQLVRRQAAPAPVDSATRTSASPDAGATSPAEPLAAAELAGLHREVLRIEHRLGSPCDVEWCFDEQGELHFLQARPITQTFPRLRYYTDTNLVESYPGRVSPLTASFVQRVYATVFRESARLLGGHAVVPPVLDRAYGELIACFGDHLYYDLESYYTALLALPGGAANIDAWHRMIGGRPTESLRPEALYQPSLRETLRTIAGLLRLIIGHERIYNDFDKYAARTIGELEGELQRTRGSRPLARLLASCFTRVSGFSLTILNDLLIMVGLKALLRLLASAGVGEEALPVLVRTHGGVDSIQPLHALRRLAASWDTTPAARECYRELLRTGDPEQPAAFYEELQRRLAGIAPALGQQLLDYLARYGDRSFEELKLESMTFVQSPTAFFELLEWESRHAASAPAEAAGTDAPSSSPPAGTASAAHAVESLLRRFPLPTRLLLGRVRGFTERAIRTRERSRMVRGRYYGWFRAGFLELARALGQEDPDLFAHCARRDFFALRFAEIADYAQGTLSRADLAAAIQRRRAAPRATAWPEFFCHPEDPAGEVPPSFLEGEASVAEASAPGQLQGTGAAGGVATGTALVVRAPQEALAAGDLHATILVTTSTDPAWIFILGRCRGLIAEKGSLLSHTAIIGRELGVPTVVGVPGATRLLRSGLRLGMDGRTGRIWEE